MKLRTLRLAFCFGLIFVSIFMIATIVCLFSQERCLLDRQVVRQVSIKASLERFYAFQELLVSRLDYEENAHASTQGLNHHIWEKDCVKTIERLCNFPIFPWAPDQRQVTDRIEIASPTGAVADGHRLFGFLLPNSTGEYQFAVASNGYAEVWLSWNKNWTDAKLIAFIRPFDVNTTISKWEFGVSATQVSSTIYVKAGVKYYFEILHTLGNPLKSEKFLQVAWKRPQESDFKIIDGESLALFTNDSEKGKYKVFDDELPDAISCATKQNINYQNKHMKPETTPILEHTQVDKALQKCEYRPSYLLDPANVKDFQRYHGIHRHIHETYSFPFPTVYGIVREKVIPKYYGEHILDEEEAWSVVYRYMDALETSYSGRYKLELIRRVERKEDPQRGRRYLLELVISDLTTGQNYILAEYVFQPNGKNIPLCYPEGLQWNRTADVYLILTAKNLGRWVHHFIKNVEKIVQETRDEHLHVVIYDFESPDINLTQAFQKTGLSNYRYITKSGNYSREVAFREAIESIKNPNAIVVTMDLHLDIGSQLINDIRKHCCKGKSVYAPQIVFLHCGGSSSIPLGKWYHMSYGTIAMYKQDWENFGGFSEDFRNKITWGGEDWDLIDNAVKGGLEIERKRSPWIYHYHHTKSGMW